MKVICLMPVKNEVDILPITLEIISKYCDIIIIADQMSDDGSREIYKRFSKVKVIDNPREGHSNQVRWDLLKAARKYTGENLILCLDADEYIPPELFQKFINEHEFKAGDSFRFPWIQLWKSLDKFNNTGVWYRNYQRAAWVDDGETDYDRKIVINDHVSRIPKRFLNNCKRIDDIPIIHLQWVFWRKTQLKQALYRCSEIVKKPKDFKKINSDYSIGLENNRLKLSPTPKDWTDGLDLQGIAKNDSPSWHLREIFNLFDKNGILLFEPLQVWHIPELRDEFIKRVKREPVSITESKILTKLKGLKLKLIKLIHY